MEVEEGPWKSVACHSPLFSFPILPLLPFSPNFLVIAKMNFEESVLTANPYVPLSLLKDGHGDSVNSLSFSPTGTYLASGGDDGVLAIWNVADGRLIYRVLFKSGVNCVMWHPSHTETVIIGCHDGRIFQVCDFSVVSVLIIFPDKGLNDIMRSFVRTSTRFY